MGSESLILRSTAGKTLATGSGRDYVWTDTSPLAQINVNGSNQANDTIDYLHTDTMGTPRLASDANQQIVWRWKWDAFGDRQVKASSTLIEMNLRYPGQYYDTETGLFYNWNRYYDPSTGRYGRSDPLGLTAGINTYGYVNGNPMVSEDFFGLSGSIANEIVNGIRKVVKSICRKPGESCSHYHTRVYKECTGFTYGMCLIV
jgi:RHS repeat-associated protein